GKTSYNVPLLVYDDSGSDVVEERRGGGRYADSDLLFLANLCRQLCRRDGVHSRDGPGNACLRSENGICRSGLRALRERQRRKSQNQNWCGNGLHLKESAKYFIPL